jgi:hypothetical protein
MVGKRSQAQLSARPTWHPQLLYIGIDGAEAHHDVCATMTRLPRSSRSTLPLVQRVRGTSRAGCPASGGACR